MTASPSAGPRAPRRPDDRGSIAVETALVIPILVLFFVAVVVFGHAIYVRYLLSKHVGEVARVCGAARAAPETCGQLARVRLAGLGRWCADLEVEASVVQLPGLEGTAGMQVEARCSYNGGVAHGVLAKEGVTLGDLAATALVPY